ncbi:hypothetical protein COT48_00885 [Candidatus Woesearchaeota archaeon CG08_land_8_20_14_0_20_47_9]|nr:MAG: hypothetical protein COT48_00885 [Candidatus Woesearchaeota archaeon CG08_land_8_20_14_0_20_47_9]HII29622.1 hypothetical protein [Candidatus Woesearchaeota archaeon]
MTMFQLSYEEIVERIRSECNVSEAEIKRNIDEKLNHFGSLISRNGAAHIVAQEYGVKLIPATSGRLQIKNILAGMSNVEVVGKVRFVNPLREFVKDDRSGRVASLVIADETGSIRLVLWNDQAVKVERVRDGDILKVEGAYVRERNGQKEIHLGERGSLVINPPDEHIEGVAEFSRKRKIIKELAEADQDVEIMATVVQVFEPRFFEVCPSCGKRAKPKDEGFECDVHGAVSPAYSYLINILADDGSESIRTVFFRQLALKLLGIDEATLLKYREAPDGFEEQRKRLLGNTIKIAGRVKNNTMFNRLEFVATGIDIPDPDNEITRLETEISSLKGEKKETEENS